MPRPRCLGRQGTSRGSDQDVRKPIRIDIARCADRIAGAVSGRATVDAKPPVPEHGERNRAAIHFAEHHVRGSRTRTRIVAGARRPQDDVRTTVAIDITRTRYRRAPNPPSVSGAAAPSTRNPPDPSTAKSTVVLLALPNTMYTLPAAPPNCGAPTRTSPRPSPLTSPAAASELPEKSAASAPSMRNPPVPSAAKSTVAAPPARRRRIPTPSDRGRCFPGVRRAHP